MSEPVDLNALRAFDAVVRTRSFRGAAERLGQPRSTVSRKVGELEAQLGVRLFERNTRNVHLTEAGAAYHQRVQAGLLALDHAREAIEELQQEPAGRLRVTAPVELGVLLLGEVVADFCRTYAKVDVELDLTDRRVDLIGEGYDVAVRAGSAAQPDSSLVTRTLVRGRVRTFAAPAYLERAPALVHPAQLAEHDAILFAPMAPRGLWRFERGAEHVEVAPRARLLVNHFAVVRRAAEAGIGVARMPAMLAARGAETGRLVPVLDEWAGDEGVLRVVLPSRDVPPKTRAFVELLRLRLEAADFFDAIDERDAELAAADPHAQVGDRAERVPGAAAAAPAEEEA
jgi:DNA-binding transcriptional LysR family regulator